MYVVASTTGIKTNATNSADIPPDIFPVVPTAAAAPPQLRRTRAFTERHHVSAMSIATFIIIMFTSNCALDFLIVVQPAGARASVEAEKEEEKERGERGVWEAKLVVSRYSARCETGQIDGTTVARRRRRSRSRGSAQKDGRGHRLIPDGGKGVRRRLRAARPNVNGALGT